MSSRNQNTERRSRFECLEERVVLSAQSVIDLMIDVAPNEQIDTGFEQIAPAVSDAHFTTGIDYVREQYGFTGRDQTVAVIDTGIAWDHYALGGGFGSQYRVVGGWDFAENDANPYDDGPAGFHGTHVAGIIGSSDSTHQGVAHEADLVALRVFDDMGRATFGWVEQALQWVHDHRNDFENPITTVNLSIGTEWNENTVPNWAMLEDEFAQLKDDGIFVAVAAGNSFQNYHSQGLSYPAASSYVVPVASVGHDGELSDFSQRNDRIVAAPGESIESTIPNHLYGDSRPSHRFLALSGTSMATPYLAGASVLVREAMEFSGYESIDQDLLYQHFRTTADEIWDRSTQSQYLRLNLRQALDAVLSDTVGDDVDSAHSLGMLNDRHTFEGTLETIGDRDYYSFVAAENGIVSIDAQSDPGAKVQIHLDQAGNSDTSASRLMDVLAGQTYTFAIASNDGLAHYDVALTFVSEEKVPPTDLGIVTDRSIRLASLTGVHEYSLITSRTGTFTALATMDKADAPVRLQLLNDKAQIVAESSDVTTGPRIDFHAAQGEQFVLKVVGNAEEVDLRLVNLVDNSGDRIEVVGTTESNRFHVSLGEKVQLSVDGVKYEFDRDAYEGLRLQAGAGGDSLQLQGGAADEQFRTRSSFVSAESDGFRFLAHSIESSSIQGGGGHDRYTIIDSDLDESVVVRSGSVTYTTHSVTHHVGGVEEARIRGGKGEDTAVVYSSEEDSRFVGTGNRSSLYSKSFEVHVRDYAHVHVLAQESGTHRAVLFGDSAEDLFQANRNGVQFTSTSGSVHVEGFDRVVMDGRAGNNTLTIDTLPHELQLRQHRHSTRLVGDGFQYVVREGIDIQFAQSMTTTNVTQSHAINQAAHATSVDSTSSLIERGVDYVHDTAEVQHRAQRPIGMSQVSSANRGWSSVTGFADANTRRSVIDEHLAPRIQEHDAVFGEFGTSQGTAKKQQVSTEHLEQLDEATVSSNVDVNAFEAVELLPSPSKEADRELSELDAVFNELSNEELEAQAFTRKS